MVSTFSSPQLCLNSNPSTHLYITEYFARLWNYLSPDPQPGRSALKLGTEVVDGSLTRKPVTIAHARRPEHVGILGKTGTGKSSLLRYLCAQDIRHNRGFIFFDLHGDATPELLRLIAQEEARRGEDLSGRVIVIDPADRHYSVGINILESSNQHQSFVHVADLAQILRDRWKLDTLGVRTEELLRNALHVLIENQLTLVELGPLLVDPGFRARLLKVTTNPEARTYFQTRYNPLSEPMRALYREAVLNKVTLFTSDPHFRHIIGQARSTVKLTEIVEGGYWVIVNLDKGRLGEQAATLGSLLLTKIRHSLFARRSRALLTLYADELQNLVVYDGGLESLFSEARKLGVSVVSANQYLEQYPPSMRAALFSVGTLLFFQLSARDAARVAPALGGGKHLASLIRNLPLRHLIAKRSGARARQVRVPDLSELTSGGADLYFRSRRRFARKRSQIEHEIAARLSLQEAERDPLDGWD